MEVAILFGGKNIHSYNMNALMSAPSVGEHITISGFKKSFIVETVEHAFPELNSKTGYSIKITVRYSY